MRRRSRETIDRAPTFAVWSHISGENQGDDMVVHTVIAALRRRSPESPIIAVSMYPPDTEARHGVPALRIGSLPPQTTAEDHHKGSRSAQPTGPGASAMRRRLRNLWFEVPASWAAYRALRSTDLLVVAGSGPLEDDPGSAYRVFKWSLLARLAGSRVAFASVGAGPLERHLNRLLVRLSLRLAAYSSVRDRSSEQLLRGIGYAGPLLVRPDMAFGYPDSDLPPVAHACNDALTVGINVMSLNDPRKARGIQIGSADVSASDLYTNSLLDAVETLGTAGYRLLFFSSEYNHDLAAGREFIRLLAERRPDLRERGTIVSALDKGPSELMRVVSSCDIVVATRFHTALLPLLLGKPVVALAYHRKTVDLLQGMELDEGALTTDNFRSEQLVERVVAFASRREVLAEKIRARAANYRRTVEAQFDELVALAAQR